MRDSQERLFHALRRPMQSFARVSVFLTLFDGRNGCICVDTDDLERPLSQCLALVRRRQSRLPIILLSGGMPEQRRESVVRIYTPLRVLNKPISVPQLLAAIDDMVLTDHSRRQTQ